MKFYKNYNVKDLIADKYQVLDIKIGGMGIVYICVDHSERRILVLKTFQSKFFFSDEQVERFKHEALLWVSMPWHRNIVKAFGVITDQELPFIALEYIPESKGIGNNLRDYIYSNILSFKDKMELSIQICQAMSFISDKSDFVHRDLKPENILVTEQKIIKITDFGISKFREYKLENPQEDGFFEFPQSGIKGTPPYMSPEQILGNSLDIRSDIFSAGIIFYELFSGLHPYINSHKDHSVIKDKILYTTHKSIDNDKNELPIKLVELIDRCLEKDPFKRFSSFVEITEILSGLYLDLFKKKYELQNINNNYDEQIHKRFSKASGLIEFGMTEDAFLLLSEITKEHPTFWQGWSSMARIYQGKREFEKSKDAYLKAIELNHEEPILWNSYGVLLIEMGNLAEAKKALNMALQLNPHYFKVYTNLAGICDEEKNYPEAIRYCEEAIKINPRSDKAWYNRCYYSSIILDYVKSVESANKAIELNPNYLKAYVIKTISCYYLFREDEARATIEVAMNLDPKNSQVQYWNNKLNN
jgi:serine/threonine protein kinase